MPEQSLELGGEKGGERGAGSEKKQAWKALLERRSELQDVGGCKEIILIAISQEI